MPKLFSQTQKQLKIVRKNLRAILRSTGDGLSMRQSTVLSQQNFEVIYFSFSLLLF
jgi:hypothetical protein